ncbi:MAG: glycosyltransferase family 4 protein [Acidobacteriota bacterium]|nr:glycosyltransferase family 4 protein [Acidobacteriota bacterium]
MTPTRVLLVTASPDRGGAETVVLQMIAGLDRARVSPSVVALAGGSFLDELRAASASIVDAGTLGRMRNIGRTFGLVTRLAAAIRRERFDIVHSHGTIAHIIGGLAAWRAGVPAIHHVHDLYADTRTFDAVLQHFALKVPAAAIVAVSHSARARLTASGAPWNRVRVVHNGVSLAPTPPAFTTDAPALVWCGRLQRWKGAHVFLDAARAVRDGHPSARFWIVGGTLFDKEPEYAAELKEQAARLGIADAVTFTGHIADARPYIAGADVLVHCSISPEPFGLVIAEALAEGKPVVAFDEGGPAEMIESGRSGRLVAPGDTDALAGAITDLLARPDLRARLAEGARQRARHFGVEAMLRRMHFVYEEVIAERSS